MKKWNAHFNVALKGIAMGIAEVIPGVSGGTIAFITGIYEKLINTIKSFDPVLIKTFRQGGLAAVWEEINGAFLLDLLIGMATGVVVGVFGITHLLKTYPQLLWAFFFGLIIASAIYVGRQVGKWGIGEILALVAGTSFAFYITIANPAQGNEALWFVFLSGLVAICALMLPGISGSFILLLLGMYTFIIPTVKNALQTFETQSLIILAVFALGCLSGLVFFSRVLSWTFKNYRDFTLALLTGFMAGSLNKLWPWRNVLSYRENSKGELVPFLEKSVLPAQYQGEAMLAGVLISIMLGFILVFALEKFGERR